MRLIISVLSVGLLATVQMEGQAVPLDELAKQLRQGGYVLVMRHASSPPEAPSKERANADNPKLERQLDEAGRRGASAMGDAIRALKLSVGDVLTSPAYRALETLKYAGFTSPTVVEELGDRGKSMQGVDESQATWLRGKVTEVPRSGNMLLVTHQPNLSRAFPDWGATVAAGEIVVLRPNGQRQASFIGRILIDAWSSLK